VEFTKSAGKLSGCGVRVRLLLSDNGIVDDDDELDSVDDNDDGRSDFRRPATATDRLLNVASCATFETSPLRCPKRTPELFGVVCESATVRCGKEVEFPYTRDRAVFRTGPASCVRAKPQRSLL
jgi:hypothetical protein